MERDKAVGINDRGNESDVAIDEYVESLHKIKDLQDRISSLEKLLDAAKASKVEKWSRVKSLLHREGNPLPQGIYRVRGYGHGGYTDGLKLSKITDYPEPVPMYR